MNTVMVRYRLKADRVAENEGYVGRVFAELREGQPTGIRYATFKLDDGVSFVHMATTDSHDGKNPLTELASFKAFSAGIKDRCDEPPVVSRLTVVASYHFHGEPGA